MFFGVQRTQQPRLLFAGELDYRVPGPCGKGVRRVFVGVYGLLPGLGV